MEKTIFTISVAVPFVYLFSCSLSPCEFSRCCTAWYQSCISVVRVRVCLHWMFVMNRQCLGSKDTDSTARHRFRRKHG